jgi:hypothetical protein
LIFRRRDGIVASMRTRLVVALLAALALLPALAATAHAAERVAIAVFNVTGQPLAAEAQIKLRASLRGGLAAAGFDVVPDADVQRVVASSGIAGCDTMSCLRRIGELVMVRRVVKATVEVIGTTHVVSTLELIDLADGKVAASAKDNCDVCTMKEVNDGLSNAAAALRMQLEGTTAQAAPPLAAAPPPPPAEAPSHRTLYIGLAAASAGLFVASVVTLGVSGALHGHPNCDSNFPNDRLCPTRYNGTPGIVLGAVGVPFAVPAIVLGLKARKSPPPRATLVPSVGPGAAALDLHVAW